MKRILITGGDGIFGSSIVNTLAEQGQTVRIMSRKPAPTKLSSNLEWAQADVITGEGVAEALKDVHTIVNSMSSPATNTYETDVLGTQQFLAQAKQSGVTYLVHISIIGIDRIILPYYQYKLASELVVIESGIPYMITRIAQFYYFIDYLLSPLREVQSDTVSIPVDIQFQAMSHHDAAAHLAPYIIDGSYTGRLADFGGAEIVHLDALATEWLEAQGMARTIQAASDSKNDLPFFNIQGNGFTQGYNTNPDNRINGQSWHDYLYQTYGEIAKS